MQDDHVFIWDAMCEAAGPLLENAIVLDIGCNQGGFLRRMVDRWDIGRGYGFDIAEAAVAEASRLADDRPLTYTVSEGVPRDWIDFDLAFSHEVLYLLHDLPLHAHEIFAALRPGGAYFAAMGTHADNPLMELWHAALATGRDMPPIYTLDDVAVAFEAAGFGVSARILDVGFVPYRNHDFPSYFAGIEYFTRHKILFRFGKPA